MRLCPRHLATQGWGKYRPHITPVLQYDRTFVAWAVFFATIMICKSLSPCMRALQCKRAAAPASPLEPPLQLLRSTLQNSWQA